MADKFILASLDDKKSQEIAEVLSNKTARKILNYLADNEASETDLASALGIPASTVNYNMQKLMRTGLVEIADKMWSEKGNRINIYRVANKAICYAFKLRRKDAFLRQELRKAEYAIVVQGANSHHYA